MRERLDICSLLGFCFQIVVMMLAFVIMDIGQWSTLCLLSLSLSLSRSLSHFEQSINHSLKFIHSKHIILTTHHLSLISPYRVVKRGV